MTPWRGAHGARGAFLRAAGAVSLLAALAVAGVLSVAHATPARRAVRAASPATLSSATAARLAADTLARVGAAAITAADLERRLALMPFAGRAMHPDSAKLRALESLVGEALLAREARRVGRVPDAAELRRLRALENALIRDALYRDEISARVTLRPAQVDSFARARGARRTPTAEQRRNAADTLRARAEGEVAREFMAGVLGAQRVSVDETMFLAFADTLRAVILANEAAHRTPAGYRIAADAVDEAVARLRQRADATLVRLAGDSMRVADVGEAFRYHLFQVVSLRRQAFAIQLNQALRALMESELLSREARRRGYAERDDVHREIAVWTTAWAAQAWEARVAARATADDEGAIRAMARRDLAAALALSEIDVQEVLCATASQARTAKAAIAAGASFDSLARVVTRREAWSANGGRSGWIAATAHRPLGDAALLARLGALSGPVASREGHSVFRVLGRRLRAADDDSVRAALASAREAAQVDAREHAVAREIAALAVRDGVSIETARLAGVHVPTFTMLTKRYLGFGGEMMAAPMIVPRWEWRRLAREGEAALP